jgi:DNA-binding LytR/AlgR family response regulator
LLSNIKGTAEYKKRFLVQIADKYRKVETADIAYFYALEKSVFFRTREGQTYPVDMTLDQIEKALDPALFFRINRKYIVNVNAISNMVSWSKRRIKVELTPATDDMDSIVSMERYTEFKKWLDK